MSFFVRRLYGGFSWQHREWGVRRWGTSPAFRGVHLCAGPLWLGVFTGER